jgi:hypothetical protein
MKTLIKCLAFSCLSLCVANTGFAQEKEKTDKEAEKAAEKAAELNHIAMKDGKLWVMKDGQTTELKEEVTLNDGTKVMVNGSFTDKNGKTETLKEGEAINWEGKVKKHDKFMKDIEKNKEKEAKEAAKEEKK